MKIAKVAAPRVLDESDSSDDSDSDVEMLKEVAPTADEMKALSAAEEEHKRVLAAADEVSVQNSTTAAEVSKQASASEEEVPKKTSTAVEEVPKKTSPAAKEVPTQVSTAAEEVEKQASTAADEVPKQASTAEDDVPKQASTTKEVPKQASTEADEVCKATPKTTEGKLRAQAAEEDVNSSMSSMIVDNEELASEMKLESHKTEGSPEKEVTGVPSHNKETLKEDQEFLDILHDDRAFKRLHARYMVYAKRVYEKFKARRGVVDEKAIDDVLKEALEELLGSSLESRLHMAEDDLRRLGDLVLSQIAFGRIVRCQMLAKTIEDSAHEQTVSNKKNNKKRKVKAASFKDRMETVETAMKRVKTEMAGVIQKSDMEFSWFDSYRNSAHMTLKDVEAFPAFLEQTLAEFGADVDLQASTTNVKERLQVVLHSADVHKHMDAILTTEFGKDYNFLEADHLVYKGLLKKLWLKMIKESLVQDKPE